MYSVYLLWSAAHSSSPRDVAQAAHRLSPDPAVVDRAPADLLLIGGGFFGYAAEISAYLTACGRRVLWFDDRPAVDPLSKAALRLAPAVMTGRTRAWLSAISERARAQAIRDVLVIKGEALSPEWLAHLRRQLPGARFVLYFWDSYRNMPKGSQEKVRYFDRAFTFDPGDAKRDSRLTYRPLFFLDEQLSLPEVARDIDLLFYGTAHTDRYAVLKRLSASLPEHVKFEKFLYLPSRLVYAARRPIDPRLWGARREEFSFTPMDKPGIRSLVARAKAVVDIERSIQSGWTMRCLEALGAGRKIVTTNASVIDADFYHPDNIAVVDRREPRLPAGFLERPYVAPSFAILERYRLRSWAREVLGV